jgi:hypothetical protein
VDPAALVEVGDQCLEEGAVVGVGERQTEVPVQALEVDGGEADLDGLGGDAPERVRSDRGWRSRFFPVLRLKTWWRV